MTEFEKLLADLEAVQEMHKAMPPEEDEEDEEDDPDNADGQIRAAASDEAVDGDGYGDDPKMMGKSMTVFDANGNPVQAIDGAEMIKSLMYRIEQNEGSMQSALTSAVQLLSQQATMIKSLSEKVERLSTEGRGRRSAVVAPAVKPSAGEHLAKSMGQNEGKIAPAEFMAKALSAQKAGAISGQDVIRAETYLNRGLDVPADIVSRVAQVK